MIAHITHDNVHQYLNTPSKPYLLLDFWTSRCESCRYNAAVADELSREFDTILDVGKVNVDENPYLIAQLQIYSVPAMILWQNGRCVQKFLGIVSRDDVRKILNQRVS